MPLLDHPLKVPLSVSRWRMWLVYVVTASLFLIFCGVLGVHVWVGRAMRASLPHTSGTLQVDGLGAPVQVRHDAHGIPSITAATVDDLVFAQGFVTAQDRLWQMDMLRRHVSGRLAEVLGGDLLDHDRTQRYLQLRESAARARPP